jgi:hypothetical protein
MAFFWRSFSRRMRARATLAPSATLPSSRILPFGRCQEERFGVGRAVQQGVEIRNFAGFQRGAFDVKLVDRLGHVRQAAKLQTDRGALVLNRFAGFGQAGFEECAIRVRLQHRQFGRAQRAGHVAAEQFPQSFEFQEIGASLHELETGR